MSADEMDPRFLAAHGHYVFITSRGGRAPEVVVFNGVKGALFEFQYNSAGGETFCLSAEAVRVQIKPLQPAV